MTSTYRFIRQRLVLKQMHRQAFIRELLIGAFDLFLAFIFYFLQHRLLVLSFCFVLLVSFITGGFFTKLPDSVGGAVFLWSAVRSKTDWAVWVRALAGNIVLCSSGTHSTLTVPLSTQVYKWVPANLMLGVRPCDGLASHPGGSRYILLCSYADFLLTWIDILVICHYRSGWR